MIPDSPIITLEKVVKSYSEGGVTRRVLDGVDTRIEAGELVVLLGRSGSGKSTILNLLAGIDRPDSGQVRVAGVSISDLREPERTRFRRERVGVIYQSLNLIPTLTVLENVRLRLELIGAPDRRGPAQEWLEAVGLADRGGSFPDVLSGGERQRVAIAAALVHDPALILADEPTGNLDEETGGQIVQRLDALVREHGKTLVMATHSVDMVGIADRVFRIDQGQLRESSAEEPSSPSLGARPH
ncbi:MAG: ABC transporter ATP-binding protein [Deltaproteobacteria bacterium]|nr:ABC transporter ATP-binding protein [Deltaproteobacteria bacterium]